MTRHIFNNKFMAMTLRGSRHSVAFLSIIKPGMEKEIIE